MTAKLYALIPRRADISVREFHAHWRDPHASLAKRITTLQRYVQSHRIPEPSPGLPESPYEGIAEAYFADAATGLAMGEDPDYVEHALRDEPNFMDVDNLEFLVTAEQVIEPGPARGPGSSGVKLLQMLRRPVGADVRRWRTGFLGSGQTELTSALGATRHVIAPSVPESYPADGPGPVYDAVRELSWPDAATFVRARDSASWARLMDPDLIDTSTCVALLAEELRVIWPDEHVETGARR
jgi:uncharacterized protein (TIGR02118 family)